MNNDNDDIPFTDDSDDFSPFSHRNVFVNGNVTDSKNHSDCCCSINKFVAVENRLQENSKSFCIWKDITKLEKYF